MKTIFKPFFLALLLIAGIKGFGQCPGNYFAYTVGTGGQVNFQNYYAYQDTLGTSPVFIWNFGDGDTIHSNDYSVNHTYTTSGNFTGSLEEINTSLGCDSVYSQSFQINLCHGAAQFNVTQQGFGYYFYTAANQSAYLGATYLWNFGDGHTATNAYAYNQFAANGTYAVSLIVTDATHSCADTSYQDGMSANQSVTLCNFPISIGDTAQSYNPVVVEFQTSWGNGSYAYSWNFGDGGTGSSGANLNHTYVASGTYNVNVTISDAGGTGCSTTTSTVVNINLCGLGSAGFGNNGNGLTQTFNAFVYDSTNALVSAYDWSFPGALPGTATGQNVSGVTYAATGSYTACLYITTVGGCIDTICQQVNITPPVYSISGVASKNGGSGFVGTVYLIRQDSTGHLALVDSVSQPLDSSSYGFNYDFYNVAPADTYYVKAALSSTDADYANYLPTYYGDVLTWGTATAVIVTTNPVYDVNIALVAGSNTGGPGFVGGYVSQGAGLIIGNAGNGNAKSLGDPIAGVQINLLTNANAAVGYTYTDANGHYQFANLAVGSYKIYAEQLNKVPSPIDFTLTNDNPVDSGANISINTHSATGIDNVNGAQITEVYPNPVVNTVQLQISCTQNADATLKIVDVLGRTNLTENIKLISGQNSAEVDMTAFAAGVYQLVIQTGKEQNAYKIVKAK